MAKKRVEEHPDLLTLLGEDRRLSRILKKCENADKDVDSWIDELMSLQASRGIRSLNTVSLLASSQRISIDTSIDNQAVRSRSVEIKIRALRQELSVAESVDHLRRYLLSVYADDLKREHSTVADRKNAVEHVLSPIIKTMKRLDGAGKIADLVIGDCDAAGFSLHRINEALTMRSVDK